MNVQLVKEKQNIFNSRPAVFRLAVTSLTRSGVKGKMFLMGERKEVPGDQRRE